MGLCNEVRQDDAGIGHGRHASEVTRNGDDECHCDGVNAELKRDNDGQRKKDRKSGDITATECAEREGQQRNQQGNDVCAFSGKAQDLFRKQVDRPVIYRHAEQEGWTDEGNKQACVET